MKKYIFILGSIIAIAILFYPTTSNSNSTGSVGGKTGSPMDNSDCTSCHNVLSTTVSTTDISSNIPSTGYIPGNTYTITTSSWADGFEITCEENTGNTKTGTFFNTNPSTTQLVNNGDAITHTAAGNLLNSWSFDWEAPSGGTGDVTFYGAFITAGYPIGSNVGDYLTLNTLSVIEFIPAGIPGCTDSLACNYDASAIFDDGSCTYLDLVGTIYDVSCNGFSDGSYVAITYGGVSPYQYSLGGGLSQAIGTFSNLTSGSYYIDVTDSDGCTSNQSIIITEPNPLFTNVFQTDVSCFGYCDGSAFSMPSGGTAPYIYLWSNGDITDNISGLCASLYIVEIMDVNGCLSTDYIQILQPVALNTSINTTDETSALNDGSITLNANGGTAPYQYSIDGGSTWLASNIFTGLSPGPYNTVILTADGCTDSSTTFVNAYGVTGIDNIKNSIKKVVKITDFLGRETKKTNQPLYYIYDDGTVEKRIIIE